VVHADLKPANFLFVKGVLKLIDFGIAREVQDDQTSVIRDSAVGTLNYMAPEAITNQAVVTNNSKQNQIVKIAPSTDVWSLGCILYSMTFGKTPFQHLNQIQTLQAIVSPSYKIDFPKYHNPALTAVLKRCLQRDAKKRPSISELLSHKFLNPKTAATPKKTPKRVAPAGLTQDQLHAILSQLPQGMVAASPGALSRTIFGQMGGSMVEGAAAPPPPPPPKFQMEALSEVALKPARRKAAPALAPAQSTRPSLQQLDSNMLANRRQALKPAKIASPRAKQSESTGMEAAFKNALDSRFKNANGANEGDTTSYTADWLTAQQ
jgi:serine/threonine protein kinase